MRHAIAHFDIDAFYASAAQLDDPSLRGKPLAVAGKSRRAVVLTASYEARPFGVRSAIPLYRALEMCPQLVVVPPNFDRYRELSREVFAIFSQHARAVEGLSLDEAFVDFGDYDIETVRAYAEGIRERVRSSVGLTVSAGVAHGKMLAKIASDDAKPDGLGVVPAGSEAEYLASRPVGRLWGVGPKSQVRLADTGITTIGQLAQLDDGLLHSLFGKWGRELRELARGNDDRDVIEDHSIKSISTEATFEYDLSEAAALLKALREQSLELAERLQERKLGALTIGIKIKRSDFSIVQRQTSLAQPISDAAAIYDAAAFCLQRADLGGLGVRLLGVRATNMSEDALQQTSLFTA